MRPSPYRWIPVILLALILLLWVSSDLLPRFVDGLLGRAPGGLGNWDDTGETLPEILWDTHDPRLDEAPSPEETQEKPVPAVILEEAEVSSAETPREISGAESGTAAVRPGASPGTAGGRPGLGSGEEGRRAARLIYQEWPREELLAKLRTSGGFRFMLRVEADGSVSDWQLLEEFDCVPCREEAERIVRSLRFRPALEDGRPVSCQLPFEIRFDTARGNQ